MNIRQPQLPLATLEHIDDLCANFEKAWQSGERPSIENSIPDDLTGKPRDALLAELIALDIDYRKRRQIFIAVHSRSPHVGEVESPQHRVGLRIWTRRRNVFLFDGIRRRPHTSRRCYRWRIVARAIARDRASVVRRVAIRPRKRSHSPRHQTREHSADARRIGEDRRLGDHG